MSRGSGTREATEERFAQRAARVRGQRARRWLVLLLVIALGYGALAAGVAAGRRHMPTAFAEALGESEPQSP